MIIVSGHQPNFLPYCGFFQKMKRADSFLIGDCCQFVKRDFHHRNKIRIGHLPEDLHCSAAETQLGWKWVTIPVDHKLKPINEIKIKNNVHRGKFSWNEYVINLIYENYCKSPYFKKYYKPLFKIFENPYEKLVDLNLALIYFLAECFNIKTKIILESELGVEGEKNERILSYTKKLGGSYYLSGEGGKKYLNEKILRSEGINVIYSNLPHPIYKQRYRGFVSHLSAIDILFNVENYDL